MNENKSPIFTGHNPQILWLIVVFFSLMISGCLPNDLNVRAPASTKTDGGKNVNFDHDLFTNTSCKECHENVRPISNPPHGGGADCMSCHSSSNQFPLGRSWKNLPGFSHNPMPTSCNSCHDKGQRPVALAPHRGGEIGNSKDCATCHTFPSWKSVKFDHSLSDMNCKQCHNNGVRDQRPMPLNSHPSPNYPHLECSSCHQNTSSQNNVQWAQFIFDHRSHTPSPTACMKCHEITRPLAHKSNPTIQGMAFGECASCHTSTNDWRVVSAFDHDLQKPTSCKSCHQSSVPANEPLHPSGNENYFKLDCVQCHTYTKNSQGMKSWKQVKFQLTTHLPLSNNCASCHKNAVQNSLPTSNTHSAGARATSDCSSCHQYSSTALWKNLSTFNHTLVTAERCDSCHKGTSTVVPIGKTTNHIATTADCKTCHLNTTSFAGAKFTHSAADTNCLSCHNGTMARGKPTTHTLSGQCSACHSQTTFTVAQFQTNYVHSNTSIPLSNGVNHPRTTTCTLCHSATSDSVNWRNLSTTVNGASLNLKGTCAGCHLTDYNKQPQVHGILDSNKAKCFNCHSNKHNGYRGL